MLRRSALLAALMPIATGVLQADQLQGLTLHDPWVREVPPVSDRSAAYVRIENSGSADRTLLAAESELFERVELHESREGDDGTMRMIHLDEIALPAGDTTALEPGGYHIMLIDRIGEPLSEADGDEVPIRLHFDNGENARVEATVRKHAPDNGHEGHDMDH